jgi:hypothetical protein
MALGWLNLHFGSGLIPVIFRFYLLGITTVKIPEPGLIAGAVKGRFMITMIGAIQGSFTNFAS